MTYLLTLDSHECYGPFKGAPEARLWAQVTNHTSYQLLGRVPHASTLVRAPYDEKNLPYRNARA